MNFQRIIKVLMLSIFLTASLSCNKVFFVDRSIVLRQQYGYIVEQRNQMVFIPMDINKDFISQVNGKTGYRIYQSPGYEGIKYAQGDSIQVEMHYYDVKIKKDVVLNEKVYIVRAIIVYTDDKKSRSKENTTIAFDYEGKTYSFTSYANRFTQVYQVVGVVSLLDKK
ncbi:hypothetical protein SAMN05444266_101361 [Chitinophaga jiangningensis]|uniref:Lipoprotein n=1 Tax=Chitinophaga jiangningensis TaxID=1419482 RepID=A0A1M6VUD5_9BACT|nr:hypothetical protein [Chitinophaga jiangningensis]SHK84955.1 hypothetical protein SAMN05444266_101361 [Chitinophaga jiangningensis]